MAGRTRYYKRKLFFTTQDRILLHLLDYVGFEGEFNQPDEITQFGIADAIGLGRSTVSKAIRRLIREKLVKGERAHVPSGKLRRTVYLLTPQGVTVSNKCKREIEEEVIVFRDGEGTERRLRMAELPKLVPEYATLLDVATHVSEGLFNAATFEGRRATKLVDLTDRVPRLRYFFGRDKELAGMDAWLASPTERVLIITGIPGIGKTTLLSRKIEDWKSERHVVFHRIMEWTTLRNVVQQLAEFLTRLGKKHLGQYLEAKETVDIEQVVSILAVDLADVPVVLMNDDYHNAEERVRHFFVSLRTLLETVEGPKLVVAGRSITPFYDRRDVRVKGLVRELSLGGLDPASSAKLLQIRNLTLQPNEMREIYVKTGGHPLFLELVDSPTLADAMDIPRYLEETLFSRLTEKEAKVLTVASVFRYPVHQDALFVDETVDPVTIRALFHQSLLREVSAKVYEVHDVVRSFFVDLMTPQERRRYHRWAALFYVSQSESDSLEALYHFLEAGEVTNAARVAVKDGKAILKRGRSEELKQLLSRLLPAVEDPAHAAELRLLKAQVLNVRGDIDQSVALYQEILQLPSDPALQPKVAEAYRSLGDLLRRQGDLIAAERHLDSALRLFRGLEDGEGQAQTLLSLGVLAEYRQDFSKAEKLYQRAIEIAQHLGLQAVEAEVLASMSRVLAARGDLRSSLEGKRLALAIVEKLGDWHLLARFQVSFGTILQELEAYDDSMRAYEQGIETARRIGDLRILAYGLWNATGLYVRRENLQKAESYLKEAESLFRKLREPEMEALVLCYHGGLWEKRGKWQLARQSLLAGLDRLRAGGHDMDFARQANWAAVLFHRNGESGKALALLQEALGAARRIKAMGLIEEAQLMVAEFTKPTAQAPLGEKASLDRTPS